MEGSGLYPRGEDNCNEIRDLDLHRVWIDLADWLVEAARHVAQHTQFTKLDLRVGTYAALSYEAATPGETVATSHEET